MNNPLEQKPSKNSAYYIDEIIKKSVSSFEIKKLSFWRRIQVTIFIKSDILISKLSKKINRMLRIALYHGKVSKLPTWYCRTIEDVIDWWAARERKRSIDTTKSLLERWKFKKYGDSGIPYMEKHPEIPDTPLNALYRELTNPGVYEDGPKISVSNEVIPIKREE